MQRARGRFPNPNSQNPHSSRQEEVHHAGYWERHLSPTYDLLWQDDEVVSSAHAHAALMQHAACTQPDLISWWHSDI